MKDVKITVVRKCEHRDLIELYENPIEHACDMEVGMTFVSHDAQRPEGLCEPAWDVMKKYVETLAEGGGDFFDDPFTPRKHPSRSGNDVERNRANARIRAFCRYIYTRGRGTPFSTLNKRAGH